MASPATDMVKKGLNGEEVVSFLLRLEREPRDKGHKLPLNFPDFQCL